MAAKMEQSFKLDDKYRESESVKQKFSKLFSKIAQVFQKDQLGNLSSQTIDKQSPKLETCKLWPKICPKNGELYSSTVRELPSKMEEQIGLIEELSSNNAVVSSGTNKPSPDIGIFSPEKEKMHVNAGQMGCKKKPNVTPEVFVFPPVSELPVEVKHGSMTRKPRRFQSEGERSTYTKNDKQRQRVASEPCITKYAQLISSRGIQLTEAANDLTEEQCRLLYEDIFKPLDFCSILMARSKN